MAGAGSFLLAAFRKVAVPIAVRNKVMLISPGSTSPVFTERAKKGDLTVTGHAYFLISSSLFGQPASVLSSFYRSN